MGHPIYSTEVFLGHPRYYKEVFNGTPYILVFYVTPYIL